MRRRILLKLLWNNSLRANSRTQRIINYSLYTHNYYYYFHRRFSKRKSISRSRYVIQYNYNPKKRKEKKKIRLKKSNKFSLSDNSIENDLTIRLYDTLLHRPINENEQRTRKNRVEKKREKKKMTSSSLE